MGRLEILKRQAIQEANERVLGFANYGGLTEKDSLLDDVLSQSEKSDEVIEGTNTIVEKFQDILSQNGYRGFGYQTGIGYAYVYPDVVDTETQSGSIAILSLAPGTYFEEEQWGSWKLSEAISGNIETVTGFIAEEDLNMFKRTVESQVNNVDASTAEGI